MEREIRVNVSFSVKADNLEDACIELEDRLGKENRMFVNECWENAELVEIKD